MKEQTKVVTATSSHPPLPNNHSIHANSMKIVNNAKIKKTDNCSNNGNSVETTDRSSTETNRSSLTSSKQTKHMNDAQADPGTFSTGVSTVQVGARQTPPRHGNSTMIMSSQRKLDNTITIQDSSDDNHIPSTSGAETQMINLPPKHNQPSNVLSQKQIKPPIMDINRGGIGGNRNNTTSGKAPQSGGGSRMIIKENKHTLVASSTSRLVSDERIIGVMDPVEQEQLLFEQRLCDDVYGVAIRKINQHGKSNLRYVKCVTLDEAASLRRSGNRSISSHSATSWGRNSSLRTVPEQVSYSTAASSEHQAKNQQNAPDKGHRVLMWGKKKDVQIPLECFVCVRKGKTTDRAKKNSMAASRILSLITNDPNQLSLDIEAPTKMDRDKFARAFACFLSVPLEEDDCGSVQSSDKGLPQPQQRSLDVGKPSQSPTILSSHQSAPGDEINHINKRNEDVPEPGVVPNLIPSSATMSERPAVSVIASNGIVNVTDSNNISFSNLHASGNLDASERALQPEPRKASAVITIPLNKESRENGNNDADEDEKSHISSITGHGYDHELIEELHNALNELRAELEESRAEAARAVKVAEQAIQSAERSNSIEWQNTVTHKAAEAAARAQKQSASAMAKARIAEEKLDGEKRTAQFWRKQAEFAEDEAGTLQTRAAAAEVQRAAMEEQLNAERRLFQTQLKALKTRFSHTDVNQREALEEVSERNRALELELDATRRDLLTRNEFIDNVENDSSKTNVKKKNIFGRRKKAGSGSEFDSKLLLSSDACSSSSPLLESQDVMPLRTIETLVPEKVVDLYSETRNLRREFESLRRATVDEIYRLPAEAKVWAKHMNFIMHTSQSELSRLKEQLAMESASRRKLLHEVQDLRGNVRVYCRPRSHQHMEESSSLISVPSHDILVLDHKKVTHNAGITGPTSFEYDRVFPLEASQQDLYTDIEDVCLSALDGYKVCIMSFGQAESGKTSSLLGEFQKAEQNQIRIRDEGIILRVMKQILSLAEHRRERYRDTFSLTIVEVYDEKLCDLLASIETGEERGVMSSTEGKNRSHHKSDEDTESSKPSKLEIRTDVHGEIVVQGLQSFTLDNFDDALHVWEECLTRRELRISELGSDRQQYLSSSHLIATLNVTSTNIPTGTGTVGKLQFVDLAGVETIRLQPASSESFTAISSHRDWRFTNRSLETLNDVVEAKCQFERTVPYRNSTLTHLLQDSLEGDTKVLFLTCVSTDPSDLEVTMAVLRFASRIRRLHVGKATKHTFSATC